MAPSTGTLVHFAAIDGKQDELAAILSAAVAEVARDPRTTTWYSYRITSTEFGIFDTTSGVDNGLGDDARAVLDRVPRELLSDNPVVRRFDVVAAKI
ncbi:hypothetical protein ACTJJE_07310 [Mycolicibacterium sp. 22603]|uniref:hypothetical protein n=1 Tax=Mycolicibacterium sp. 22603 TaxID=3453950 RepID=UPI003F846CE0